MIDHRDNRYINFLVLLSLLVLLVVCQATFAFAEGANLTSAIGTIFATPLYSWNPLPPEGDRPIANDLSHIIPTIVIISGVIVAIILRAQPIAAIITLFLTIMGAIVISVVLDSLWL